MDAGLAAIIGATIGMLGAIAGTVVVPFVLQKSERREALALERQRELRRIIAELFETTTMTFDPDPKHETIATGMSLIAQLDMWLEPSEWPISRISRMAFLTRPSVGEPVSRHFPAATLVLPAWARGDMTADNARMAFEKSTGEKLKRDVPAEYFASSAA